MNSYQSDLGKTINYNGSEMPLGIYNLLLSIRDVKIYCRGMKINRHWKITNVKTYFGIKGSKEKVLEQLEKMLEDYKTEQEEAKTA